MFPHLYLLQGVLRQQVVQQVDVLQPQSGHVQVVNVFLRATATGGIHI